MTEPTTASTTTASTTLAASPLAAKVADVALDHMTDIATDVVLPTAKYAAIGFIDRKKKSLLAVAVGLVLIGVAVSFAKRRRSGRSPETTPITTNPREPRPTPVSHQDRQPENA